MLHTCMSVPDLSMLVRNSNVLKFCSRFPAQLSKALLLIDYTGVEFLYAYDTSITAKDIIRFEYFSALTQVLCLLESMPLV